MLVQKFIHLMTTKFSNPQGKYRVISELNTDEEFKNTKTGLILPKNLGGLLEPTEEMRNDPVNRAALTEIQNGLHLDMRALPATYNPVGTDAITSVKDQGSCRYFCCESSQIKFQK